MGSILGKIENIAKDKVLDMTVVSATIISLAALPVFFTLLWIVVGTDQFIFEAKQLNQD